MPASVAESSVQRASEPEFELSPLPETSLEAVGPVMEQGAFAPTAETTPNGEASPLNLISPPERLAPDEDWMSPAPSAPAFADEQTLEGVTVSEAESRMLEIEPMALEPAPIAPEEELMASEPEPMVPEPELMVAEAEPMVAEPELMAPEPEPIVSEPEPIAEPMVPEAELTATEPEPTATEPEPMVPEDEPIGQGQPIPYQMPVAAMESALADMPPAAPEKNGSTGAPEVARGASMSEIETLRQPETPSYAPKFVVNEPSFLQTTTRQIMPEPTQMQTAPVIRTPATGATPQPASAMLTAVQLSFAFDIASMQLTPTFKMGALQLRPTSKIVTMRLAPAQQPQPAMNLQVTFEIAKIQPAGGGLGTVRLLPSQQQRPQIVGSPSFTVAGLQLVSNFEAAPVQLTPSQQAAVMVTASFQIATVEFSPSFEIASIVLNSTSKQVAVQLAGTGTIENAPMFEIANLQLGPSGEIGMMQLNLLGSGVRRG